MRLGDVAGLGERRNGITTVADPGGRRAAYVAHLLHLAGRNDILWRPERKSRPRLSTSLILSLMMSGIGRQALRPGRRHRVPLWISSSAASTPGRR